MSSLERFRERGSEREVQREGFRERGSERGVQRERFRERGSERGVPLYTVIDAVTFSLTLTFFAAVVVGIWQPPAPERGERGGGEEQN